MVIGGLQKFSLLDYPEHLSAIIFTQGCNFRCQYCYNPMLVRPIKPSKFNHISSKEEKTKGHSLIEENDLFVFLKKRLGKLDAVVITGGEPTLHKDLPIFIKKIKKLGFKVKLDTNGTNPKMIKKLIKEKLLDYIAMDLKADFSKYDLITGVQSNLENIKKSIKIIIESGLDYEFRTTVVPKLVELSDIKAMGKTLSGANKWYLQKFQSDKELVNDRFTGMAGCGAGEMEKMKQEALRHVKFCEIR
ncbi:anaerobic ribonucleoside-triphosphate reductase activating protein [Candidatus Falkowbacteria bacterium]|nr:MAG: anaerobic ribonucleoside-triphosphate reductase activating protein [Candidatus Falkowbacteria bacterium]